MYKQSTNDWAHFRIQNQKRIACSQPPFRRGRKGWGVQTKKYVYNHVHTKYKRLSSFSNPKSEKGGWRHAPITLTYSTKWARHDSSCNGEIKLAHVLRNNCEYLRNNGEYLIHNCNNLYNNIKRADKLTSMTSFVAGCISIEPTCVYNHLAFRPSPPCLLYSPCLAPGTTYSLKWTPLSLREETTKSETASGAWNCLSASALKICCCKFETLPQNYRLFSRYSDTIPPTIKFQKKKKKKNYV